MAVPRKLTQVRRRHQTTSQRMQLDQTRRANAQSRGLVFTPTELADFLRDADRGTR